MLISEMTTFDIQEAMKKGITRILFPFGSTEQHGAHIPLKMDAAFSDILADDLASKLGKTLVAPTQPVGYAPHHMGFSGTLTVSEDVFIALMLEYFSSAIHHGFTEILSLSGHGGNYEPMKKALAAARVQWPKVKFVSDADERLLFQTVSKASEHSGLDSGTLGIHAGEHETSIAWAVGITSPEFGEVQKGFTGAIGEPEIKKILGEGTHALSANGVVGDPTQSDKDRGKVYYQQVLETYVEYFRKELA